MLLNFDTEVKSSRPVPKGPEAETNARGYEADTEAEAKILASRLLTSLIESRIWCQGWLVA